MPRKIRNYTAECAHSIDREVPLSGLAKKQRIDLGLDIALASGVRGPLTLGEIATWCGCTTQAISLIEQRALRKLRMRLSRETAEDLRSHLELLSRQSRQPGQ